MKKKPAPVDSKLASLVLQSCGQRDRLLVANRHQSNDIFALTAALREVYGILKTKSAGFTDAQRIDLASKHVVDVIGRYGAFMPPQTDHRGARLESYDPGREEP